MLSIAGVREVPRDKCLSKPGICHGGCPIGANFDGVTTFKRIVEFPGRDDLKSDVGIVFVELVQPSGVSINERVTLRVCVHQAATQRTQSTAETKRVVMLLQRALAN